ncbi:envelope protein pox-lipid membrane protein [Squirrelpox virus]|uniref:A2L n=2 Tax=Squirrelpox virus TaxID=240426 RepID=Q1HTU2_9POXV|nr:envelope protein pox-lipid membrane protein [Squirrelpox virus]ABD51444.1 A2L [Squirrelpox virus]CCD83193.1 envelope protein pox-lipid membrane protein [Squirrelpox virus]
MDNTVAEETLYDIFVSKYLQRIAEHAAPTQTACAVHIGEIRGTMRGCELRVVNRCMNNARLSFSLMRDAFEETVAMLPESERRAVAAEVGFDPGAPRDQPSVLERNCSASAAVNDIVDIQKLDIGECFAPPGRHILVQIVNSGSAEANCGLESVARSLNKRATKELAPLHSSVPLAGLWKLGVAVLVALIAVVLVCAMRRRIALKYRYGAFVYV